MLRLRPLATESIFADHANYAIIDCRATAGCLVVANHRVATHRHCHLSYPTSRYIPSTYVWSGCRPTAFTMEYASEDLSWLHDCVEDFGFNGTEVETGFLEDKTLGQRDYDAHPTGHTGFVNEFVNPADLHHVQRDASRTSNQTGHTGLPLEAQPSFMNTDTEQLSAMDEFFRLQGGWRPPVPCNHCKRLRLQCFMLQTTAANPNPITSCSSCVALYRHCSLAGPAKRQASTFETPNPVIGQLHGVYEDQRACELYQNRNGSNKPIAEPMMRASKRSTSQSKTSTRSLRLWFGGHLEHPYPTEHDRKQLASASGLSRTQIDNWFSNARRRKKQSEQATSAASLEIHRQGSPMPPKSTVDMTPLERWQHSPPDAEPAQFADIERAIDLASSGSSLDALQQVSHYGYGDTPMSNIDSDRVWHSLPGSVDSSSATTSSCNSRLSHASSGRSFREAILEGLSKKPHRRSKHSDFRCTECVRTFTRKSDLLRHERAVHSRSNVTWICSNLVLPGEPATVWRISQPGPECALCGQPDPDEKHLLSHEFVACADRNVSERTFTRKDHLFQHLEKFHRCRRKWDGWSLDDAVDRLRHVQDC
jgi:hypothetical protein